MEDELIKVKLKLTEKQCGYLLAAVLDFHHKMRAAAEDEYLVGNIAERLHDAKDLMDKVEKKVGEFVG